MDWKKNGVRGSSLIREQMAVNDFTTEGTEVIIDPVMAEIIDQTDLAERLLGQAKEQGIPPSARAGC